MDASKRARWSNVTFMVGFGLTLLLLLWVLRAYLVTLVLAACVAVVLMPAQDRLAGALGGKRVIAGWILTVLTFALLLVPLTLVLIRLIKEAAPAIAELGRELGQGGVAQWLETEAPAPIRAAYETAMEAGLAAQLRDALESVAAWLAATVAAIPSFAALIVTDAFVLAVALVWFLHSGPSLYRRFAESLPMERQHTDALGSMLVAGVRSIILVSLVTALIQGAMGFVAFWIVKLPYPLLLAGMMAFFSFVFSLVPVLGSGLVWGPAGLWLIITGRVWAGVFILAYGALVLGSVDNIIKPFLTKGSLRLPPALVFVSIFGGLGAFGPIGAILGPLTAAAAGAFLRLWRTDFLGLPPDGNGAPPPKA